MKDKRKTKVNLISSLCKIPGIDTNDKNLLIYRKRWPYSEGLYLNNGIFLIVENSYQDGKNIVLQGRDAHFTEAIDYLLEIGARSRKLEKSVDNLIKQYS